MELKPSSGSISTYPGALPQSLTVKATNSEVIFNDPGRRRVEASAEIPIIPNPSASHEVEIAVHLGLVNAEHPVVLTKRLPYPPPNCSLNWWPGLRLS